MAMIREEIERIFGFTQCDALMIVLEIQNLNQWLNFDDLKLQAFRFAARLKNGGC